MSPPGERRKVARQARESRYCHHGNTLGGMCIMLILSCLNHDETICRDVRMMQERCQEFCRAAAFAAIGVVIKIAIRSVVKEMIASVRSLAILVREERR